MFHIRTVALALLAAAFVDPAGAQVARIEVHTLATQTLSVAEFLSGRKDGKRDTIAGELRIPRAGTDRLPAVILMHGTSGAQENIQDWSELLNAMGVATFVLDSFTGRGISSASGLAGAVGPLQRSVDAFRSLELLAKHPRIDRDRIAVMGFSHGAYAALYSSVKRFARLHGPADGLQFAAHIVFYPGCNLTFLEGDDVSDRPVRVFHGSEDDWLPVAPCRDYAARLRSSGKDVVLTEYAGAHHSFDRRTLKEPVKDTQATSFVRCRLEETADGQFLNIATSQPFTPRDACVERGRTSTTAYHAPAHAEAVKAVTELIAATLKPK